MSSNPSTQGPSRRVVLYAGLEIAMGSLETARCQPVLNPAHPILLRARSPIQASGFP